MSRRLTTSESDRSLATDPLSSNDSTKPLTILGAPVCPIALPAAARRIISWSLETRSRYVCVANAHTLIEAHDNPRFLEVLDQADLVVPDGMPLVWLLRVRGRNQPHRVYGPKLMDHLMRLAAKEGIPIGFYGSKPEVLCRLVARSARRHPDLRVVYQMSPPFREMRPEEDAEVCAEIRAAGVKLLFLGLGCPKQEQWMAAHSRRLTATMVGVGAAFDFIAGTKPQAPRWMQASGLEWLFRLVHEPRRLWRRYIVQGPRFAVLVALEFLGLHRS